MRLIPGFVFVFLFCSLAAAADLTTEEKAIVAASRQETDSALALLERVVNINSGTMNHEGVRQVGAIFQKEFDAIGFETRWIPMEEVNRSGHLFGERKGNRGKRLLLIGHLDTVFEKEFPFQPFTRKGDRATGQGVNDMKGGDVVALYALRALQKAGVLENTTIIVAFIGDEEMSGDPHEISRRDLIEAANRSDVALGFESAEGLNTGTIARRGVSGWTLKVTGKQAHSSGIFTKDSGFGAVFEASRILHTFYDEMEGEQYLTFNPGVMVGGTEVTYDSEQNRGTAFGKTNVIARTAIIEGDLRFISTEQREKARERMRKIATTGNLGGTSAEITFSDGYPSMAPTEGNMKLLVLLDQVSRDLDYPAVVPFDPGARGAADISWVSEKLDCLDGLGTMGNGGHTPEEDMDLPSLHILIERAAILIYRLTR